MNKSAIGSVVSVILVTIAVVIGATMLLRSGEAETTPQPTSSPAAASQPQSWEFIPGSDERPDCIAGGVGDIELPCLGGDDVEGTYADVTIVNVWAWWCGPCRQELPVMNEFAAAHPEYDVVGVHADPNAANGVALLNELGVEFPSYQDDANMFKGLLGLPPVVPIVVVYKAGQPLGVFPYAFYSLDVLEASISEVLEQ